MHTIENKDIRISVAEKGAEWQSLVDKSSGKEYLWSADAQFWAKKSPVLFPIVGALKNDTYHFKNNSYHLKRHGFAREMDFELQYQDEQSLHFLLKSGPETLANFPFDFSFKIIYRIDGKKCLICYEVLNTGSQTMYFSVGGHPAFAVPIFEGTCYNDYFLKFNEIEHLNRWPISASGLLQKDSVPFMDGSDRILLNKELFASDAIVLKQPNSTKVSLLSNTSQKGIEMDFSGFPYLGIWAAPGADFVCLEPWCGIADSVDTSQAITAKEGINELMAGEIFSRTWSVLIT